MTGVRPNDGTRDIEVAVAELAERLPDALHALAGIAFNYRWSWMPGGAEVFRDMDPSRWDRNQGNPRAMIETVPPHRLKQLANDRDAELWDVRRTLRSQLVEYARVLSIRLRQDRGEAPGYVESAALVLRGAPLVASRVAFLEDYDLDMARRIVAGVDLWVNVPRPPLEASGTSGMKVVLKWRSQPERPRWVVDRGVRRGDRVGDRQRARRPRGAGRPRRRDDVRPPRAPDRPALLRPRRGGTPARLDTTHQGVHAATDPVLQRRPDGARIHRRAVRLRRAPLVSRSLHGALFLTRAAGRRTRKGDVA